jgi:hypothetical protein
MSGVAPDLSMFVQQEGTEYFSPVALFSAVSRYNSQKHRCVSIREAEVRSPGLLIDRAAESRRDSWWCFDSGKASDERPLARISGFAFERLTG